MKRLLVFFLFTALVTSCDNDDENVILACDLATEINSSNITHNSASLNWTNQNGITEVSIEYGPSGFQKGSGIEVFTSDSSIILSNLQPTTTYDFYVTANCSIDNTALTSDVNSFTTDATPVVAQFLPNLSQLHLFSGDLAALNISPKTFKYELNTQLYTDYAHKLRTIALPPGASLEYNGDGFPIFPTGSLISKTFYYNLDETNPNSEKRIIETRVLIKESDAWTIGNYVWNEEQTEAVLSEAQHDVKIDFKNADGQWVGVDYVVPGANDCVKCHSNYNNVTPIGPKLRTMNFNVNGVNQLQKFIDNGHLSSAPSPSSIGALPNWEDTSLSLEERGRAYFDVNCAHCHEPGGFCDDLSTLDLRYETDFEDTNIYVRRFSISARMGTYWPGTSMPLIGTTMVHTEGYDLIQAYLDSL